VILACHKCGRTGVVEGQISNRWTIIVIHKRDSGSRVISTAYEPLCDICTGEIESNLVVKNKRVNAFISRHKYVEED
jgi:hypothetical protein